MTQQTLKGQITYTDHDRANVYLDINNKVQDIYDGKNVNLPYGWHHFMSSKKNYPSNFKAVVLRNGDKYAIVYFGTDIKSGRDLWADLKMGLRQNPQQFKDALKFTEQFMKENGVNPEQIDTIGNSEGGAEGMYVMSKIPGINHGTFFNAYPPNNLDIDKETQAKIDNYRHENDIVSKCGAVIGNDYIVNYKDDYMENKKLPEFVNAHRIENMGDLRKAVPAKDYAQQNPKFKNKFRVGTLKSYEIGDIPKELYALADPDINDRIKNKKVVKEDKPKSERTASYQSSQCVGSYPVSGYTRADGTHVSDYTRTCGAAHNGQNPYKSNYMSNTSVKKSSRNSFVEDKTTPDQIEQKKQQQKEKVQKSKDEIRDFFYDLLGQLGT